MNYELVYYTKKGRNEIKHVIVSGSLKDIDNFILKKDIKRNLELFHYIDYFDTKKAHDFKIISSNNKKTKDIIYSDNLRKIYDLNLLDTLYNLYIREEEFKNIFNNRILSKIINMKDESKIKDTALNVKRFYPSYDAFYKFFTDYLSVNVKMDENKELIVNYSYTRYRELSMLCLDYINEYKNSEVKKYVKSRKRN